MTIRITINDFDFQKRVQKLQEFPKELTREAYRFFKKTTPIRTGNARRRTVQQGNKIQANYRYAGKLEDGYSKQAPQGMTKPTIDHLRKYTSRQIRRGR